MNKMIEKLLRMLSEKEVLSTEQVEEISKETELPDSEESQETDLEEQETALDGEDTQSEGEDTTNPSADDQSQLEGKDTTELSEVDRLRQEIEQLQGELLTLSEEKSTLQTDRDNVTFKNLLEGELKGRKMPQTYLSQIEQSTDPEQVKASVERVYEQMKQDLHDSGMVSEFGATSGSAQAPASDVDIKNKSWAEVMRNMD